MSVWAQAGELAAATPPERNRYADFLRAASILFVIVGHWLMTTAHYNKVTGELSPALALDYVQWSAWLTWAFQVMPIFFIVGGFSNAITLEAAAKKNQRYAEWLAGRLHRLLTPLTLLVVAWALIATGMFVSGVNQDNVKLISRTALVPTWFLAIYTMIVLLAPATYALWQRWGYWSLSAYVALAAFSDFAFFNFGWEWLGWTNYFWVWLAMHHLGFAWRDNRIGTPATLTLLAVAAFTTLFALIHFGPYPIAMAGSPGEEISNTLPPKATLIALGLFQFGLLLAIEKPMQRVLNNLRFWTVTVIINTIIMTVYLWHMTVLILVIALCYWIDGFGLGVTVGSVQWWSTRPAWLLVLTAVLIPLALALSPLERLSPPKGAPLPNRWRLIGGAIMAGAGITTATLLGFDGNPLSLTNSGIIVLMLGGAWVCGVSLRRQSSAA